MRRRVRRIPEKQATWATIGYLYITVALAYAALHWPVVKLAASIAWAVCFLVFLAMMPPEFDAYLIVAGAGQPGNGAENS